jgi:hypothetical protein
MLSEATTAWHIPESMVELIERLCDHVSATPLFQDTNCPQALKSSVGHLSQAVKVMKDKNVALTMLTSYLADDTRVLSTRTTPTFERRSVHESVENKTSANCRSRDPAKAREGYSPNSRDVRSCQLGREGAMRPSPGVEAAAHTQHQVTARYGDSFLLHTLLRMARLTI